MPRMETLPDSQGERDFRIHVATEVPYDYLQSDFVPFLQLKAWASKGYEGALEFVKGLGNDDIDTRFPLLDEHLLSL